LLNAGRSTIKGGEKKKGEKKLSAQEEVTAEAPKTFSYLKKTG